MVFASALITWLAISTGFTVFFAASHGNGAETQIRMMKAQSERWIADRQARLDIATQQATANSGSLEDLANTVEKRHNALIQILKDFKGVPGAVVALAPAPIDDNLPPVCPAVVVSPAPAPENPPVPPHFAPARWTTGYCRTSRDNGLRISG